MEENQVPNQVPNQGQQFNATNGPSKKKGLGPVKGTLLALLLAIIVIAIGFLVRMLVQGDGDYLLPFKQMFGIEEEEGTSSKKKSKKEVEEPEEGPEEEEEGQKGDPLGGKYTLLSPATSGDKVEHYRMTMNMGKLLKVAMKEYDKMDLDLSNDQTGIGSMAAMGVMLLQQMADVIDGEIYGDIYFEGNDLVQIVFGYDYEKLLTKLYDYMKKNSPETLTEEKITSADDLGKYVKEVLDENLTEEFIYNSMIQDKSSKEAMEQLGLREKDIKEAIDIVNEEGLFEFYITGTTKIKGIISLALSSKDFQESIKDAAKEYGIKIDEDDVFASFFEAAMDTDEFEDLEDYGMTFVKIK